ncbi:transglutaminase [Streptomyces sp. 150FB]|uniref:transglutaminase-like domain-containing protein n=1 Tax=Streptomyces sp. 150FB TaxID=1576605 RepID=UPI0005890AD3|nr:transglutaminase family protein [Streptomyces sp. 150FB]KIF73195.1 transglutaminase [Streptomyces sp. 150FB]
MPLIQEVPELSAYLGADEAIDHEHPLVRETAARLAPVGADAYTYAEAAFVFVRDTIPHSMDSGDLRVTWRASDVLEQRTGICYAKAHALTALLRARGLPAALCYQGLGGYQGLGVVHGLVAVRLPGEERWARQDPRGNKPGVDARFSLGVERLAFALRPECSEVGYPVLYAAPHPAVLTVLKAARDRPHLDRTLPATL